MALYVDKDSIAKNYAGTGTQTAGTAWRVHQDCRIQEGAPSGTHGLVATEARAVVKVRDVQKSLNQLSKEERIDFIRANGDPGVAIRISIRNADSAQPFPPDRSMVAENVLKDRIKSFGFGFGLRRMPPWAPTPRQPDFQIDGEVKLKTLSARLPSSGLTISKTALTSVDTEGPRTAPSGEEVYLNTVTPNGKSWATEDQALMEIGKLGR